MATMTLYMIYMVAQALTVQRQAAVMAIQKTAQATATAAQAHG